MSHYLSFRSLFGSCLFRYSLIVSLCIAVSLSLGLSILPAAAHAASNAARIFSLDPSCAAPGETIMLVGNGLGSKNITVKVGGVPAQVLSATGNRVTFIVPSEVVGGVTVVTATNPGGQTGSIAFRVKTQEVCGDQIDDDCDSQLDDPDVCVVTNHSPVAQAGADQTASVDTTVSLDGSASSDPDGNPLTFQWSFVSKPTGSTATLHNATGPTPSFLLDQPGIYVVQLLVSDRTLTHADSVTVSTANSVPVADAGTDRSGPVETTVTLDGSASSDVDGNPLTYQWTLVSKPAGSTATLTALNNVTPSFTIDVFGDYVVQLLVHDGTTSSAPDTVTISTLNSAPVANAGADQNAHVGETVPLDGSSSSDIDGNPLTFQWVLTSRPTDSSAVLQQATTAQPTVTIDKPGTYVTHLVVNDGIASSEVDTVVISTLNSKPAANAGADQSGTVGTTIHLDGSHSSDVDGDTLTAQWSFTNTPAGSTATLQNPTTLIPSFVIDKPGAYIVQLLVYDGTVESAPDTVLLTTLNSKPVANAGTDQSHPVGTTVTLDGSGSSDVDGDTLTYAWALTTTPTGSTATVSDPSAVQPTFGIDKPGTYTAQLLVHDGTGESVPVTVTISTVNSKPIANPGLDQHGTVGTTMQLTGSGSHDVDGDALTYQWSFTTKPATSTATIQTPTSVTPSFVLDKAGTYTVQLIVHDGTVDSDPATVTITTLNSKPVANAGADQTVLTGHTVQLDGSGSQDVDDDALSYFWSVTAAPTGSTATVSNGAIVNPTFIPDLAGTYVLQLIVNDGTVESDPDTVTLTVNTLDTFPPAPADLDKIIISPVTTGQVTVSGSAGSVEGGATVTITNPRTGETVTVTANADGSFIAQLAAQEGDQLSLVVTDAAGNSSPLRTVRVAPTAQVTISSPVSGASLSGTRVRVQGTVQGPVNTGVTVNGVVALVYNDVFVADNVLLIAGSNTITAIATPFGGQGVQAQVTVTSDAVPQVLKVTAAPVSGIASLEVTFTYQLGSPTAIEQLRVDFDGNGSFDFTTTDLTAPLQHTYTTPGLYVVRVQVTDQQGGVFDADVAITVHDIATLDGLLKSLWNGMNAALVNGDIPSALTYLDSAAQEKYGPVWQVLLPHMSEIIASYSPLRGISASGRIAEYGFTRIINGEKRLFLVYFLQDNDGVWRLSAM